MLFSKSPDTSEKLECLNSVLNCIFCFGKTFYISVDASFCAVDAHISNEKPPNDCPIEYFSKSLNVAQINYATTHKELLAIVLAIERFKHYVWDRHFVVYTDHEAPAYSIRISQAAVYLGGNYCCQNLILR